jgi:TonB family protein
MHATSTPLLLVVALTACAVNNTQYALDSDGIRMDKAAAERAHANAPLVSVTVQLDKPPKILRSVFPPYPQVLIQNNIVGSVTVQFDVEPDGTVSNPIVVDSPHAELAAITMQAIKQWKFDPAISGGKPVRVRGQQTFRYQTEE